MNENPLKLKLHYCIIARDIDSVLHQTFAPLIILSSVYHKMIEKSSENKILAKGNNSCKSRSSVMKLKLDLYYVITNSYIKIQVNTSKDYREKFGKQNFSKGQ